MSSHLLIRDCRIMEEIRQLEDRQPDWKDKLIKRVQNKTFRQRSWWTCGPECELHTYIPEDSD